MTRIFVLTNHKGGVGKSTSATTIAFGITSILHHTGATNSRVLLIDTDSQGHATLITTGHNDFGASITFILYFYTLSTCGMNEQTIHTGRLCTKYFLI